MRKMKNYLKIGILLLGLILIMTNCETENEAMENPITIEKEFIIKQYHFKDLSSNFTFQKAIEKLNSKKSKSIYSNKSTDDFYNFTIDSTRIKEVIKGNYTSYTLLINRPFKTSEYFENLVIEIKENETINAFIIKYILSSPIKIFEEHNSFSFQANFTIVPLDINNINLSSKSTSNSCSQIAQTWCSWDYPHIAGQSCYLANDNRLYTVLIDDPDCPENGYPSYGGGGGGGTTGSDPDPIYTSPINPDGTPIKFPVIPSANLINNLEGLNDAQIAWINDDVNEESVRIIDSFLNDNNSSPEAKDFALLAINALINGWEVDFEELYISHPTPDDNYIYQGTKQYIPNTLILTNGDIVTITFVTHTKDNLSSNQKVSVDLVDALKISLEQANQNLSTSNKITSINIYATTNGGHGQTSNHYNGTSLDINSINTVKMIKSGITNQISGLQTAFDNFQYIRENFGPFFKHKYIVESNSWDYNNTGVGAHKDHIHISVRR